VTDPRKERGPALGARLAGAVVGGGGAYAVLRLTGAWGLGHEVAIAISAGLALAGFLLGPIVWRALLDLA
jgi:hypothetical protein